MNNRRCNLRKICRVFSTPKELNVDIRQLLRHSTPSELGDSFRHFRRLHLRLFTFNPFGILRYPLCILAFLASNKIHIKANRGFSHVKIFKIVPRQLPINRFAAVHFVMNFDDNEAHFGQKTADFFFGFKNILL